ncbi:NAD-dependent epimerase/dehydratase family protein [Actinacidiphila acididurans]|uniref:NAD-dependent epimerase/dehydratase family protein n=1 Tax=Actinacidiphila acididurans TaxID=2784346 RepID=A0ABS2TSK4_9ACTN|nr:NAD-dependent epimerase/dehydratase family protein [Actinacidiphila acididurans]MBM9506320.1 NAD-dependent epimerase/dehydratase family protein [Actinacidiphila acididurans]
MRVVVIGGTGHVGSYLVPRLVRRGHDVTVVTRGPSEPYHPDAAWDEVKRVHADRSAEDAAGTFGARIAGFGADAVVDMVCFTPDSARALTEALRGATGHLLHCGTVWVHGVPTEVPVTEDAPRRPFGDYGVHKAAAESYLLGQSLAGGVPTTVLHPGHISGPGWVPVNPAGNLDPDVFGMLARGEELWLPNSGLETLHHVHADDVAQSFELALHDPAASVGRAFHICSERALTLRGYAEAVAGWFGRPAMLHFAPFEQWAAGVSGQEAGRTYEHIARSTNVSIDRARRVLGYAPRHTSLQAVREALAWLVAAGRIDTGGRPLSPA